MKKIIVSTAAFAVVAFSAIAMNPTNALANSAFSRQTGQACSACHFQTMPRLNAFGRDFRINAFRATGTQGLVEDEGLSLPDAFNAGLLFKAKLSNGKTEHTTAAGVSTDVKGSGTLGTSPAGGFLSSTGVQWPDEAEFLIGGRVGEHFGMLVDFNMRAGDVGLEKYKLTFVYDTEMGPVALTGGTSNYGAPWLMNDPSNAVSRSVRGWQHRSVALKNGIMNGSATALGLYTQLNGMAYLAVGGLIPATIADGTAVNFKLSPYVRAAFTGDVAGFDVVAGGWYYANKLGDYNAAALGLANVTTTQYGLDAQIQGDVGGVSVGFYVPWQIKGEQLSSTAAITNEVSGVYPVLTVATGPFGGRIGYDYAKFETTGQTFSVKQKIFMAGAWYQAAQNVVLDLEYTNTDIDNQDAGGAATLGDNISLSAFTLQAMYMY